ncbi:MAG: FadR family transcriptional regulator [Planctomycetota bacterium]|nr:MAG: FadR family transcriptional regulator [Planctomycetota bacterium]
MLKAVKRPKIRDVVALRLKNYIAQEFLQPGDRLPTETELADRFGVNRLSLREATKALEFLGIVDAKPGRGLTVGRIDMQRIVEHLGFHPALHDVEPGELIDTRTVIETGVLPFVARRMRQDPSIHERLTRINADLRRARSLRKFVELDIAFHHELVAASGVTPLMAFSDMLVVFFRRFLESVKKGQWQDGADSHQFIIDALQAGKVAAADKRLRKHIESHRKRIATPK